ncbi:ATP-binding protein [Salmonella enterica]|uniref:ATP-binding protein n=2 Tax=Enterobacteriaceae TaxID=543 RepID=A0A5U5N2W1_SALER|nr:MULTISPECIES: ATP-binding protein [Enterobacteriaceae]EAA7021441.1 ATP-binding protein [Salmonella enterica subsp. enterica serovar Durham]EBQ5464685.1 ATP-binding protein [Salmonella enterica]ECH9723046.1 ATP-binding protein [Salmonella enterica subsp. enterica]EFA5430974.1 ATP-binding protein [Escherichia coli]EKS6318871.1 ATP-binding protein [Enterobacter hormaechei]HEI8490313.1 ATP-binding protein [Citrobacter koseri]
MSDMEKLKLRYSHNIIEHLGLKLYQNKPTNVIAELISNSWDADAQNVWIEIAQDKVSITDDGCGMSYTELMNDYLIIGKKKRSKDNITEKTARQRNMMGRKGIGKLAPFGIAKKLTLITISKEEKLYNWIQLDLSKMLSEENDDSPNDSIIYEPTILADNIPIEKIDTALKLEYKKILDKLKESGTAIILEDLSLKKIISSEKLKESVGQRFTVTLLSDDFNVYINETKVSEKEALPNFYKRYPESGYEDQTLTINGQDRQVRYWVGFVESAEWPQDQAGVGIYAHGKLAQDRPFVFGLKGREIWTRYMYGVIEADWLDELEEDVVSTDRTSVNWMHEDTLQMYEWGAGLVRKWISDYQKFQKENNKGKVIEKINKLPTDLRVTEVERKAISDIVCSMSPKVQKDETLQNEVISKLTSAWTHAPSHMIIQSLWNKVKDLEDEQEFIKLIDQINDHLVPESMSLSVMVSQRIYALTKLERLSKTGTEPQLQSLLEQFPWILGSDKGKVHANQTMKEIAKKAAQEGKLAAHGFTAKSVSEQPDSGTRPDFTIFSDTNENNIILIELKSPLLDLERIHLNQLNTYMGWFEDNYDAKVYGYLIGRNPNAWREKNHNKNIEVLSWHDICVRSRKDYIELLAAMLYGVSEHYDDARIKRAVEFGGSESIELLKKMAKAQSPLKDLFDRFDHKTGGALDV